MTISALSLFKCMADETRLLCLLLIEREGELCVCELMSALEVSQPKVSRHLAQLRSCGLLEDRREAQWVYYRLSKELPKWVTELLSSTARAQDVWLAPYRKALQKVCI